MAATTEAPPIDKAKLISVYQNGDEKNAGKKIIINKRKIANFDVFLDHITDSLRPRFGAVRRLYTPVGGHRITDLEQVIQRGENYVAAGQERFHRIGYLEIEVGPRKRPNKGFQEIKPVQHSRIQTSGRIRKIRTEPIIIFVHPNGNDYEVPHRIQLRPREQGSWEMVLDAIKDRVSLRWGGAIRRLCNLEGRPVQSVHEIENSGCYVACGTERFVNRDYEHPKVVMHSPRQERRLFQHGLKLTPLNQSQRTSKKGSQNSSVNRTPDPHNGSVNSRPHKARRNQVKKEDPVIYEKPVAYKRNGERKKEVNYDQDPGGVFKSQNENQATRGAVEITEDRETRVDVPVDQRKAEVVEEESIADDQDVDKKTEATPPPSRKVPSPLVTPEPTATDETEELARGDNSAQRSPSPAPVEDVRMSTPEAEVQGQAVNEATEDEPVTENRPSSVAHEDKAATEEERNKEERDQYEEQQKAAITIQSGYRGYRVRRDQQQLRNSEKSTLNQDQAATVIQSRYRGYKTRQHLKLGQ